MAQILKNKRWIFSSRPGNDKVGSAHYTYDEVDMEATCAANEVIVENKYISVDPYMRIHQAERFTFDVPHPFGVVQGGGACGIVVVSNHPKFQAGDWVFGLLGWQKYAKTHGNDLTKLDTRVSPTTSLGVLGLPGRTAWFGLMDTGRPRPGETVVVSAAAGATGSLVAQFAKKAGCRVIGIAGGPQKCAFLMDKLKLDGAIDYKEFNTTEQMAAEVERLTGGVDVYFDNTGGWITDAIIPLIKLRARIIVCGQITQYNGKIDRPELGPRFMHHLLFKRATMGGMLARDYLYRMDEMRAIVTPWVIDGSLVCEETIVEGFEKLPDALGMLFDGSNLGKLIVQV